MVMQGTLPQNRVFLEICQPSPAASNAGIKSTAAVILCADARKCLELMFGIIL